MTRPRLGPRPNCWPLHSRTHPTLRLIQPTSTTTPNYLLLSLIAEKVDGKPLAQSMQDRLFGPLRLQHTVFPALAVHTLPEPYSHGYLYGSASVAMVGSPPYSPDVQAAARAGTLLPRDYTDLNHSFAAGAGAVISTASDLATWIEALVAGRVLNAAYQRRWLDSLQPEDPRKPKGQRYGYGIVQINVGAPTSLTAVTSNYLLSYPSAAASWFAPAHLQQIFFDLDDRTLESALKQMPDYRMLAIKIDRARGL
jgi:CubicO group peptidase (beta-lactamase class C family)